MESMTAERCREIGIELWSRILRSRAKVIDKSSILETMSYKEIITTEEYNTISYTYDCPICTFFRMEKDGSISKDCHGCFLGDCSFRNSDYRNWEFFNFAGCMKERNLYAKKILDAIKVGEFKKV